MPDPESADPAIPAPSVHGTLRLNESLANEILALFAPSLLPTGADVVGEAVAGKTASRRELPRIGPVRFREGWVEIEVELAGLDRGGPADE